jgi:NAD(P)-dependent dehydrogenase (short-subunit alcohol dehydrogenase family)
MTAVEIDGSVALVSGADRGLGRVFAQSASKAAEWSLTNGIRMELSGQGTLVVAVHASFIDTDMAAGIDVPKISPESVAQQTFDAVEAGEIEVLADDRSRFVKASLPRDHELIYALLQQQFFDVPAQGSPARVRRRRG